MHIVGSLTNYFCVLIAADKSVYLMYKLMIKLCKVGFLPAQGIHRPTAIQNAHIMKTSRSITSFPTLSLCNSHIFYVKCGSIAIKLVCLGLG